MLAEIPTVIANAPAVVPVPRRIARPVPVSDNLVRVASIRRNELFNFSTVLVKYGSARPPLPLCEVDIHVASEPNRPLTGVCVRRLQAPIVAARELEKRCGWYKHRDYCTKNDSSAAAPACVESDLLGNLRGWSAMLSHTRIVTDRWKGAASGCYRA